MAKSKKTQDVPETGANAMVNAMMAMNPAAATAWLDILSESTRFVTDRLRQDMETQMAMLSCKSPAELMQVQSEFFSAAMEQYADETRRLLEMMSKAAEDTLKEAKTGHARSYDDVPL